MICVRPHVGHDTTSIPPVLSPSVLSISFADFTSSSGLPVSDTLIVSPIPWFNIRPRPIADFILPLINVPASVIPT